MKMMRMEENFTYEFVFIARAPMGKKKWQNKQYANFLLIKIDGGNTHTHPHLRIRIWSVGVGVYERFIYHTLESEQQTSINYLHLIRRHTNTHSRTHAQRFPIDSADGPVSTGRGRAPLAHTHRYSSTIE